MWVDLRYGQASTQRRCRYGGRGAGQQAPERAGAVPGQFHLVGDLAEGGLDVVAPLGDDVSSRMAGVAWRAGPCRAGPARRCPGWPGANTPAATVIVLVMVVNGSAGARLERATEVLGNGLILVGYPSLPDLRCHAGLATPTQANHLTASPADPQLPGIGVRGLSAGAPR